MNRALVPSPLPTEEGILNFLLFSILQYFKSRFYHGTRLEAAHLKIRDFTRRHPIIAQLVFLAALPVTIIGSSVLCFCAIVGSICFGILSCIALFWICAALLLASPFLAPCACITTIVAMLYLVLNFIVYDVIYGLRLRPPRLRQGVWTFITDLRHIVTTIARYLIGLINQLYSDPWTSLTHLFIAKAPRRVQLLFGWVFRFVPGDSYIWTRPRANMFGEYSESQASVLTSQIIGVNRREKPQRRQASVKSFLSYYAAQLIPYQWQENATALKQDILDMFLWHTPRLIPQRWVTRVVFLPMWVPLLFVRSFCACADGTFRRAFAYVWRILSHLLSLVSRARDFAIHSLWQVCSSFGRVKSLPTWVVQLVGTWYYERLAKIASCVFGEWRISSKAITLKGNLPPRHQSYLDRTLRLITLHMDQVHVVLTRNPVIVGILALVFTPAFLTLSPMWVPLLFVRSFCACVDGTFRRAFAYVWRILSHLLFLESRARDFAIHSLWQVCSSFGRVKSLPTWVVQLVGTWYYERLAKIASCVFGEWRISSKAITLKGNLPPRHQSYLNRTLRLITLHMDQVHVVLTRNPVIVGILALVFTPAFLTLSPVLLEFAAIWLVYRVTKRVVKFFAKCLEAIFVMITHLEHAILRNIFLAIRLCRQLVAKISRAIRFTINTIATLLRITVNAVKFFIACLNPFFLLGVMRRAALWIFWSYFRAVYIFFDVFTSERISKRLPALAEYFDAKPTAIHQPMTSEDDPCDSQSSSEHFIRIIYTRFNPDESDSDGQASTDIPLTTDVSASSSFDHTPLTPRYDSDVNAIESVESLGRSLPRFDTLYKGRMHDPMETSPSSKAIVKVHKNKHPNLSISPPRSEPEMENASKPEVAKAPSSLKERAQYNTVPKLVRQLRVSKQQLQEWRNTPYLVTVSKEQRKAIESTMRESKDEQVAQTKAACEASEELKQSSQGSHDDPGVKEVADVFGWIFIWVIFPSACFVWYYAYTCVKEYYLNNYY